MAAILVRLSVSQVDVRSMRHFLKAKTKVLEQDERAERRLIEQIHT